MANGVRTSEYIALIKEASSDPRASALWQAAGDARLSDVLSLREDAAQLKIVSPKFRQTPLHAAISTMHALRGDCDAAACVVALYDAVERPQPGAAILQLSMKDAQSVEAAFLAGLSRCSCDNIALLASLRTLDLEVKLCTATDRSQCILKTFQERVVKDTAAATLRDDNCASKVARRVLTLLLGGAFRCGNIFLVDFICRNDAICQLIDLGASWTDVDGRTMKFATHILLPSADLPRTRQLRDVYVQRIDRLFRPVRFHVPTLIALTPDTEWLLEAYLGEPPNKMHPLAACNSNDSDSNPQTALHFAVQVANLAFVERLMLLARKRDFDFLKSLRDGNGLTPAQCAANKRYTTNSSAACRSRLDRMLLLLHETVGAGSRTTLDDGSNAPIIAADAASLLEKSIPAFADFARLSLAARDSDAMGDAGLAGAAHGGSSSTTINTTLDSLDKTSIWLDENDKLGVGVSGAVFGATYDGAPVAVKRLRIGSGCSPEEVQRELSMSGVVKHPHIVQPFGFYTDRDDNDSVRVHLVMERAQCGSLDTLLHNSTIPLTLFDRILILRQIASGMRSLHARGITHRDLKSANILMTERAEPKIADFGLSRDDIGDAQDRRGTPAYKYVHSRLSPIYDGLTRACARATGRPSYRCPAARLFALKWTSLRLEFLRAKRCVARSRFNSKISRIALFTNTNYLSPQPCPLRYERLFAVVSMTTLK
jgi:hypothetical protein